MQRVKVGAGGTAIHAVTETNAMLTPNRNATGPNAIRSPGSLWGKFRPIYSTSWMFVAFWHHIEILLNFCNAIALPGSEFLG